MQLPVFTLAYRKKACTALSKFAAPSHQNGHERRR